MKYVDDSKLIDGFHKYNTDAIAAALVLSGATQVTIEHKYGWKNRRQVVVFNDREVLLGYLEEVSKLCNYPLGSIVVKRKDW